MKFYHEASKIVKPKLEALAVAEGQMDAANKVKPCQSAAGFIVRMRGMHVSWCTAVGYVLRAKSGRDGG